MLTVWGRKSSSNVQAVMWCIAELKLAVTRVDAGFTYGLTDTADYLSMNPNGKVPTLQDDQNSPIWESGAILRYLAQTYSDGQFWPTDPAEKSQVDMWAEWAKLNIAGGFTGPIFWRAVRVPAERRDSKALTEAVALFEKQLMIADNRLQDSSFLAGDNFTLADIQFGHVLYRYYDIDIHRTAGLVNVARYYRDMKQRPDYQEHVMVSYDELADSM